VLVAITILALAGYQYSDWMVSEYRAADNAHRAAQAKLLADSGIHYTAALLANPDNVNNMLGSNIWDNSQYFMGIQVPVPGGNEEFGKFTIIAPLDENSQDTSQGLRYGVTDEGGKINLNVLMQQDPTGSRLYVTLMLLPNMTQEIANSIIDWLDPDNTPRDGGAEDDYYMALSPPYHVKNGPLESIEELLLVKGVTPQLLFGNDLNRNGIIDPEEDDGSGPYALGWAQYLTVWSRETNADPTGNALIYLNNSDLQSLYSSLSSQVDDSVARYVILYLQNGGQSTDPTPSPNGSNGSGSAAGGTPSSGASSGGAASTPSRAATTTPSRSTTNTMSKGPTVVRSNTPTAARSTSTPASNTSSNANSNAGKTGSGSNSQPTGDLDSVTLDFTKPIKSKIKSIWQLVNSQVTVQGGGGTGGTGGTGTGGTTNNMKALTYASPLNDPANQGTMLPLLFSTSTVSQNNDLPARINLNTAPVEVLQTLPELQDTDIQNIVSNRPQLSASGASADPIYQTPAWLLVKAQISTSTLQTLDPFITTRSQVFRVQSVGYFDGTGPSARVEAIVDLNGGRPRILNWRDLTPLGKGWTAPK
jgi:DNA uptake protein ComE-like DNA-binding protein